MLRGHLTPQRLLAACITAGVFALTWFSSSSDSNARQRMVLTSAFYSLTITSEWEETTGVSVDLSPFRAPALLVPGPSAWQDDKGRVLYYDTLGRGGFETILKAWQLQIDADWESISDRSNESIQLQTMSGVLRNGAGSVHIAVSSLPGTILTSVVTCLSPLADDKDCPRILDSIRAPDTRD